MATGRLVPGYGFVVETTTTGRLVPGYGFVVETESTGQTLNPSLYTNNQTFYAPTVTPGAVTVSPPLYESMELLGRERSMQRLRAARDGAARNLW